MPVYAKLKNDKVNLYGVDQDSGELAYLNTKNGFLVIKLKGRLVWSARSEQTYHPACFQVYRILENDREEYDYKVELQVEFPLRKKTPYRVYREGKLKKVYTNNHGEY